MLPGSVAGLARDYPPADLLRAYGRLASDRGDSTLAAWLMSEASRATQIENGAIEISFHGSDIWGFEGSTAHDPAIILVKGTQGSEAIVDALCSPDSLITLPVPYSTGRGRIRRAVDAFHVAPLAVAQAVAFLEVGSEGDSTTVTFRPPDTWPHPFVRIVSRPRQRATVRGEPLYLDADGVLAVCGREPR